MAVCSFFDAPPDAEITRLFRSIERLLFPFVIVLLFEVVGPASQQQRYTRRRRREGTFVVGSRRRRYASVGPPPHATRIKKPGISDLETALVIAEKPALRNSCEMRWKWYIHISHTRKARPSGERSFSVRFGHRFLHPGE